MDCDYRIGLIEAHSNQTRTSRPLILQGRSDGKNLRYSNRYSEIPARCAICPSICEDLFYKPSEIQNINIDRTSNSIVGAYLGASIGDAMGFPFEGSEKIDIVSSIGYINGFVGTFRHPAGTYSDDTELILMTGKSIGKNGEFNSSQFIELLRQWLTNNPRTPGDGIQLANAFHLGLSEEPRYHNRGNGAAVRILPVALANIETDQRIEQTLKAAEISHKHPESLCAAVCQSETIAYCRSKTTDTFRQEDLINILLCTSKDISGTFHDKLTFAFDNLSSNSDKTIAKIGNSALAIESVVTALYLATRNYRDFKRSILSAVNVGGDCDTIASLVGASIGALQGYHTIPKQWIDTLENQDYIIQKALDLSSL